MYTLEEKICILLGEKGVVGPKFFQLWEMFDGAEDLVANIGKSKQAQEILGASYSEIVASFKRQQYEKLVDNMCKHEVVAVSYFSNDYPERLRQIDDKPYILFCKGDVSLLDSQCLSVVGTRKISSYGRRVTKDFTAVLCEYFTIVSGLAYGVDSVAHETTLDEHGKTIAVLGGGLLSVYPASNQGLADRIVRSGGLLVTEYGMDATPWAYHFPHRNRLVSALGKGLLVCQAPAKSGTNSTVELALEQGRDVFAVPGEIYDASFWGNNHLIKSVQGVCVTTPRDIVDFYGLDREETTRQTYQMSIEEQAVVNALTDGPLSFDNLVERTGISAGELNFLLANLELRSIIAKLAGNTYRLYGGIE